MMNYEINKQDVYLFLLVSSVILAAMPAAISAALLAPVAKSSLSKNIIFNVKHILGEALIELPTVIPDMQTDGQYNL